MTRLLAIFVFAILAGCAGTSVDKRTPIVVLDNNGGFSHGGRRIELHEGGLASSVTYTDVIDDRIVSYGRYDLRDDVLLLRFGDRGNQTLHRVAYDGKVYWVYPDDIKRVKSRDGIYLRQTSLKQQDGEPPR